MFTLIVSAFMIVWLNPSLPGVGSHALGTSGEPLLDGFKAIYGENIAKLLALVAVLGLCASFHTIIFAKGRQIYSLSRSEERRVGKECVRTCRSWWSLYL